MDGEVGPPDGWTSHKDASTARPSFVWRTMVVAFRNAEMRPSRWEEGRHWEKKLGGMAAGFSAEEEPVAAGVGKKEDRIGVVRHPSDLGKSNGCNL